MTPETTTAALKRFSVGAIEKHCDDGRFFAYVGEEEHPEGKWVRYEDVEAALSLSASRGDALREALTKLSEKWRDPEFWKDVGARMDSIDCALELDAALAEATGAPYEKNGISAGERVVCIDVPRLLGTVVRCAPDGVDVRWDDGKLGELVWRADVAHNAYRLQVVRAEATGATKDTK